MLGLPAGTEVALAERPVTAATGGEGGGEGDEEVGETHWVWYRSWVRDGGMPW